MKVSGGGGGSGGNQGVGKQAPHYSFKKSM